MGVRINRGWGVKKPPFALIESDHPLARGLSAFWLCHEGAGRKVRDLCGKYHGSIGGTGVGWGASQLNGSQLSLGSISSTYVNCGPLGADWNNVSSLTMCFWGKRSAVGNALVMANRTFGNYVGLMLAHYNDNTIYFNFGNSFYTSYALSDAKLHFYVGVYNGKESTNAGKLKMYIDGKFIPEASRGFQPGIPASTGNSNTSNFYLGFDTPNGIASNGFMENARLYNRPLTAAEVSELYTNPYAGLKRTYHKPIMVPVPITASASLTAGPATLSAEAAVLVTASLATTLANAALSSLGAVVVTGSADLTGSAQLSSDAAVLVQGSGSVTADDATLSGSASTPISASASLTTDDAGLAAAAALVISAAANLTTDASLISTAAVVISAEAAIQAAEAVLVAFTGRLSILDADLLSGPATLSAQAVITDPDYNPAWNPTDKGLIVRRAEDAREDFRFSPWGPRVGPLMAFLSQTATGKNVKHTRLNSADVVSLGPDSVEVVAQGESLTVGTPPETFFLLVLRPSTGGFAVYVFGSGGPTLLPGLSSAEFVTGAPASGEIGASTSTDHVLTNNTGAEVDLWVISLGI